MTLPPPPGSSFYLFPNLPPELRLHIWSFTISHRIVDIFAFNKRLTHNQERNALKDDRVYTSQSSLPILSVCRESREFALGVYKHALDTEDQRSTRFQLRKEEFPTHIGEHRVGWHLPCRKNSQFIPGEIRSRIYFNLEKDVFCLNGVWWFVGRHPLYPLRNYLSSDILHRLRYLAVPFEMFGWAISSDMLPRASRVAERRVTLADFKNLTEVIINMDSSEDERDARDLNLITPKDITKALEGVTRRNPGWKPPKWRLVRDRASLGVLVERRLLT
jgi:hypothetical protein